ncbi:hypothetical protein Tco_1207144 [Tanacetum coccineum]
MKEWMASQTKTNERMKNQVVELENQINQGLRNHQVIIQNLERQFEFLLPTETLPPATNTKPRHEIVYSIPSIRNYNDKGDVKFIEEEETEPNPTMPNPNLIMSNSPTVSPFLKDCTVHIPYTQEKVFEHDEISNHVGDKELISFVGIENEVSKRNIEDTKNPKKTKCISFTCGVHTKNPIPSSFKKGNFPFELYHQRILNLGKSLANDSEIN